MELHLERQGKFSKRGSKYRPQEHVTIVSDEAARCSGAALSNYHKIIQNKSWETNPAAPGLVHGELGGAEPELGEQPAHVVAAPHGALLGGLGDDGAWGRDN